MVHRLKVLTGYAAHFRFLSECDEEPVGETPNDPTIPSPYCYSPTRVVHRWRGQHVVVYETRHRRYEVYEISGPISPIGQE